ncbi:hypothetical protein EDD15DRAFT_2232271, partial [Pisolithus albus]
MVILPVTGYLVMPFSWLHARSLRRYGFLSVQRGTRRFCEYLRIGCAVSRVSTFSQLSSHVVITSRSFIAFHLAAPCRC